MTDVTISRSNPPAKSTQQTPTRAQPPADDVRAMAQAFSRVRGDGRGPGGQAGQLPQTPLARGQTGPQSGAQQAMVDPRAELARAAGWRAADERGTLDRRDAERGGEQSLGMISPTIAPAPGMAMLPVPSPQVDPAGFAQMLADLWTRENGRGDREVRVRFGADAWPATGALLVQSADGVLDVTIDMAPGCGSSSSTDLVDAFGAAGLAVGRVATREDAG